MRQPAAALCFLHSRGVVHNDVKPENLLALQVFDPELPTAVPTVVLADFGCATSLADDLPCVGDPRYASPEGWRLIVAELNDEWSGASAKLAPCSDVWMFCATLFVFLSSGLFPFLYRSCPLEGFAPGQSNFDELQAAILSPAVVDVLPHCPGISPEAAGFLRWALAKDPLARPSALEVLGHRGFHAVGETGDTFARGCLELRKPENRPHSAMLCALARRVEREYFHHCWEVFRQFDRSYEGQLLLDDFRHVVSGYQPDSTEIEHIFRLASLESAGNLNFIEFMAVTFPWGSLDSEIVNGYVKALFEEVDQNRSGYIEHSDLDVFFEPVLGESDAPAKSVLFGRMDSSGDGRISLNEFGAFLVKPV